MAGYFVNCINQLTKDHNVEIHIVAYSGSKEAPFTHTFDPSITIYNRVELDTSKLQNLLDSTHPDFIYCAGWSDKEYIELVKNNKKVPSALGFDNQWLGTTKQYLGLLYSRVFLLKNFNYAFVSGQPQMKFALKMGFSEEQIVTGVYSCDIKKFNGYHDKFFKSKEKSFPKKLIFVGRYLELKGIYELFDAFIELSKTSGKEWELHCLGTGPDWEKRTKHPQIIHHGFVQPKDFESHVEATGAFVLPSHFEPWGVVVHEFAAAGYPMIISTQVGAGSDFLREGVNGWTFEGGNKNELKACLEKLFNTSDEVLQKMGEESHNLAQSITPETWAASLLKMVNGQ